MQYTIKIPSIHLGATNRIPKRWVYMERVRSDLNVRNGAFWVAVQAGAQTEQLKDRIQLYRETDRYVYLPRHYKTPWTVEGKQHAWKWINRRKRETSRFDPLSGVRLATIIKLRDKIQHEASQALQKRGDKFLALSCGKGKTVVSLQALAQSVDRFPALIVVNTNALMTQWRREIEKFYQMKPHQVGHIQQGVLRWRDCHIAVAMLHTLVKRKYDKSFYRNWKTIVFDEAHRLGTEHFVKACTLFPGERWGLSATLKRDDGMDKVIRLHMGEEAYENLSQPLRPSVWFVRTDLSLDEKRFRFRRGKINLGRLSTAVAQDEPRNKLILYWIERAANQGRKVLVLGERLAQLNEFYQQSRVISKSLHVGSMKAEERERALQAQVIFATQHLAKEGLDVPALDTLFILQPFGGEGRLRQSVGRILRIVDGKKAPVVVVFEDSGIGFFQALCNKMKRHLTKLGWKHKTIGRGHGLGMAEGNSKRPHQRSTRRVRRSAVRRAANRETPAVLRAVRQTGFSW